MEGRYFLGFIFVFLSSIYASEQCVLPTQENTAILNIVCNYEGTDNYLPGVEKDKVVYQTINSSFKGQAFDACPKAEESKQAYLQKLEDFLKDKTFVNLIVSGHGVLLPTFDARGKFLKAEWALVLPSAFKSDGCLSDDLKTKSAWGTKGLSDEIKRNSGFRKNWQEFFKKCADHFLRYSELPFREDMTVTGLVDTCHSGGAACSIGANQQILMASADKLLAPDSQYFPENDPNFVQALKESGAKSEDPALDFGKILEELQKSFSYKFEKDFDFYAFGKSLADPLSKAIFEVRLKEHFKKNKVSEEKVEDFLKRFNESARELGIFYDVYRKRSQDPTLTTQSSFSTQTLKDLEARDLNKDSVVSVEEFYQLSADMKSAWNIPQVYKGNKCSSAWLSQPMFEVPKNTAPASNQREVHTQDSGAKP